MSISDSTRHDPAHPRLADLSGVRVLVTGGGGRLARRLAPVLSAQGAEVWAPPRAELDLLSEGALQAILDFKPGWIIHPAGMTNVDACEADPAAADAANAGTTRVVGEAAQALGCGGIYISTDYVFGGGGTAPYAEEDVRSPVNAYGRSKARGEEIAIAHGLAIARVAWLYGDGEGFEGFVQTQQLLGAITVARQRGTPTHIDELCRALASISPVARGVYHLVGAESITRESWARHILKDGGIECEVVVDDAVFEDRAPRPEDSSLVSTRTMAEGISGVSAFER